MRILGIVGFGFVGTAIQHGFAQSADFRIFDVDARRSTHTLSEVVQESDVVFVCLPTPMTEATGEVDLSIIKEAVESIWRIATWNNCSPIVVIKSTVIPGTTESLQVAYPELRMVFNPEFLTERTHKLDFINQSRIILGGNEEGTTLLEEIYSERFPGTPIFTTSSKAAELVKYICNCFFAVKLSFFNEMKQVSDKLGIRYEDIIGMILTDARIGNSHWSAPGHDGNHGWGGKCFPKDLNALVVKAKELGVDPTMLEAAWKKNLEVREVQDWYDIEGAVSVEK